MAILSLSKTCRFSISSLKSIIHVDDQISEKLSLSCTAMELKFALRKSTSCNFLYYSVFENNTLHRTVSVIVVDEWYTVEERCTA